MPALASTPARATDTDLRVAAAYEHAATVAAAWARAPLDPAAQEAALAYLLGPATVDRAMVAQHMDEDATALRRRLSALIVDGGSA